VPAIDLCRFFLQPFREIDFFSWHKKALDAIGIADTDLDMAFCPTNQKVFD
jgi:hypothetical protein